MPRLVRRQSLVQRIKSYLNPFDLFLRLSEEIDSSDWDQWENDWATPLGIALNVIFLIAKANTSRTGYQADDIFGEDGGVSWLTWLVCPLETPNVQSRLESADSMVYFGTGIIHCSLPRPSFNNQCLLYL
jgi:hypothetical protein